MIDKPLAQFSFRKGRLNAALGLPHGRAYLIAAGLVAAGLVAPALPLFAREFCVDGYAYRAGDAVNFSIGQGDTMVSPLQLARAYAAISNGGTLFHPQVGALAGEPLSPLIEAFADAALDRARVAV